MTRTLAVVASWTRWIGISATTLLLLNSAATQFPNPSLSFASSSGSESLVSGAGQTVALADRESIDTTRLAAAAALEQLVAASANQVLDRAVLDQATADIHQERQVIALAQMNWLTYVQPFGSEWTIPATRAQTPLPSPPFAADAAAISGAVVAWQNRPIELSLTPPAPAPAASTASTGQKQITVFVRTTVDTTLGGNGQSAINAGGEVGVIYPGYGTIVSAHNTNDARALSLNPGDTVTFTGAVQGSYRVTGAIKVPKGATVASVAALGTAMMMQTCIFGTNLMRIVGMTAI